MVVDIMEAGISNHLLLVFFIIYDNVLTSIIFIFYFFLSQVLFLSVLT